MAGKHVKLGRGVQKVDVGDLLQFHYRPSKVQCRVASIESLSKICAWTHPWIWSRAKRLVILISL